MSYEILVCFPILTFLVLIHKKENNSEYNKTKVGPCIFFILYKIQFKMEQKPQSLLSEVFSDHSFSSKVRPTLSRPHPLQQSHTFSMKVISSSKDHIIPSKDMPTPTRPHLLIPFSTEIHEPIWGISIQTTTIN